MGVALHPYIIGFPHRIGALDSALEYICGHESVWSQRVPISRTPAAD
jgi:allantoinase